MQFFASYNALDYIIKDIFEGILLYLESHRELLSDPEYNCAYKFAKNEYIKSKYGSFSVEIAKKLYDSEIHGLLIKTTHKEIDKHHKDLLYLIDIVRRYDLTSKYVDLFESY